MQNRKWIKFLVVIVSYFLVFISILMIMIMIIWTLFFILYFSVYFFAMFTCDNSFTCYVDTRPYVSFKCFHCRWMCFCCFFFVSFCCLVHLFYLLPRAICFWVLFFLEKETVETFKYLKVLEIFTINKKWAKHA